MYQLESIFYLTHLKALYFVLYFKRYKLSNKHIKPKYEPCGALERYIMKVNLTKKNCGNFIVITSKYKEDITIEDKNAKSLYSVMNLELPKEYDVIIHTGNQNIINQLEKELEKFK